MFDLVASNNQESVVARMENTGLEQIPTGIELMNALS